MKQLSSRRGVTVNKPKKLGAGPILGVALVMLFLVIGWMVWILGIIGGGGGSSSGGRGTGAANGGGDAPPLSPHMVRRVSKSDVKEGHVHNVATEESQSQTDEQERQHLVFSTACSLGQDWQSYFFFYQAMAVKQPGTVTRIVSGCTPEKQQTLQATFDEQIRIMSPSFRIHFTPEFGKVEGKSYQLTKYWNKPFSLRHWLEHTFGYDSRTTNSTTYDNDIIILIDPDMFLQRPLVNDFSSYPLDVWTSHWWRTPQTPPRSKVEHGYPIAQLYGFGASWFHQAGNRLSEVVGKDSPVLKLTSGDASKFYASGPPYILTARDWYQVSIYWTYFLPKLFDIKPNMMNEMYGYSLANAHLQMPNQLARGFMVSNVDISDGEGWQFLNDVPPENICNPSLAPLPNVAPVVHFCQRYTIGDFFMSKYKTHANILSCGEPLFKLPPEDAAVQYDYSHFGNGDVDHYTDRTMHKKYRHAFMICSLLPALNAAATFFKKHHCDQKTANYEPDWNFFTHWKDK